MKRRDALTLAAATALPLGPGLALAQPKARTNAQTNAQPKRRSRTLRYALANAVTTLDPVQVFEGISATITSHIFEGLYHYDHLARPPKVVPLVATSMPDISPDYRVWTIRITTGIHFADDAAFAGKQRELTAEDFVYSFKRFADPATKSPNWALLAEQQILGLAELRQQALDARTAFDYDRTIEGLRALDRYTLQFTLAAPRPRLMEILATTDVYGAMAREVVQQYGSAVGEHPVGTGPFRLAEWRRSSRIVLVRNPSYRKRLWHAEPAADDADGQAIKARFEGRPLPILDRVEIAIITEAQPRWLAFLNGDFDLLQDVPAAFINVVMPGGQLAPNLARQGIRSEVNLGPNVVFTMFNMDDPVVGGLAPHQVALRRAIGLSVDLDREINVVRHGMAIPAQSPIMPFTSGYDPDFKSENSDYSPARANALLDLYGYVDRNGDGWRERPDGTPLVLRMMTQPTQSNRAMDELWRRNLDAVGLKVQFEPGQWPENLKAARAASFQIWGGNGGAVGADGQGTLTAYYGPQVGSYNLARFSLPAFDELYDELTLLPDGPERNAVYERAKRLAVAYMPYKLHVHQLQTDLIRKRLQGYRRPVFWVHWWHMVDLVDLVDGTEEEKAT